ncbi:hypothetical protein [Hoyosella subflava]|nr:hypothetical protein [Hoyosella subflava]
MNKHKGSRISYGRLALFSLGAGAGMILVATLLILALQPQPVLGLVIALAGLAAAVAAMGVVSTRMTRRAVEEMDNDSSRERELND